MLKGLTSANFNSISIQLRKCCNHPYMVSPDVETEIKYGSVNESEETDRFILTSGKTILLMKLL
jgi:SNF2 family DNA or RNA helicase